MYKFIINPKTNRKVSIYGNLGKKIIQNYLNSIKLGGGSDTPKNINTERIKDLFNNVNINIIINDKVKNWLNKNRHILEKVINILNRFLDCKTINTLSDIVDNCNISILELRKLIKFTKNLSKIINNGNFKKTINDITHNLEVLLLNFETIITSKHTSKIHGGGIGWALKTMMGLSIIATAIATGSPAVLFIGATGFMAPSSVPQKNVLRVKNISDLKFKNGKLVRVKGEASLQKENGDLVGIGGVNRRIKKGEIFEIREGLLESRAVAMGANDSRPDWEINHVNRAACRDGGDCLINN